MTRKVPEARKFRATQARPQYEGAVCHVMARGTGEKPFIMMIGIDWHG